MNNSNLKFYLIFVLVILTFVVSMMIPLLMIESASILMIIPIMIILGLFLFAIILVFQSRNKGNRKTRCDHCNAFVTRDAEYCRFCGEKIYKTVVCEYCGTENGIERLTCSKCNGLLK